MRILLFAAGILSLASPASAQLQSSAAQAPTAAKGTTTKQRLIAYSYRHYNGPVEDSVHAYYSGSRGSDGLQGATMDVYSSQIHSGQQNGAPLMAPDSMANRWGSSSLYRNTDYTYDAAGNILTYVRTVVAGASACGKWVSTYYTNGKNKSTLQYVQGGSG